MKRTDEWKLDREEEESSLTEGRLEQKFDDMTKEYRAIRVPDGLKGRILQTIQETDKTMRQEENQNLASRSARKDGRTPDGSRIPDGGRTGGKARLYLMRTAQTAAAALLAITVLANTSATTAYAMEQIPVIGAITKVVTFRTYEKKEGNTEAKVEIPRVEAGKDSGISGAAEKVNRSVEDYTNQIISRFEQEIAQEGTEGHKGLYSDYKVLADNDRFFTLELRIDEIMASGAQSVKIYNIDKKTDRILELKDLFPAGTDYVAELSRAVEEVMRKNMQEDESKVYFLDDEIGDHFEAIKENQNFYINDKGNLVLVFDEYEVAPGSMGLVEIELPSSIYRAE